MPLILPGLPPIHWAVGGAGIALITLALLFVANRRLGISTGLEDVCSFVLPVPYFARDAVRSARKWRLPFIAGLVAGGVISAAAGGGFPPAVGPRAFLPGIRLGPARQAGLEVVRGPVLLSSHGLSPRC